MNDHPWTCDDCGEDVDNGEILCKECSDRRYEEWRRYQDWLRMTDREWEVMIRTGGCGPGRHG